MPEVLEAPAPFSSLYKEFNMSPARDQHNELVYEITFYLNQLFKGKNLIAKFDTFRYLEDWLINAFGDFKNAIGMEKFVAGLRRFGAKKEFIQEKLDEFAAFGSIPPGYAPDVLVVQKTERHNRFSLPLLAFEVLSESSRNNDLYFKPFFYETIGVGEYFVCETQEEAGRIIRGYRLENRQYQQVLPEKRGYFSEIIGRYIPEERKL